MYLSGLREISRLCPPLQVTEGPGACRTVERLAASGDKRAC